MYPLRQQGRQGQMINTRGLRLADVEIKVVSFFVAREFDGFPHVFSLCGVQSKLKFWLRFSLIVSVFGPLKLLSLLQQSRGRHVCNDGVCQTPRGLGIYYSKTIQRADRGYAVTWVQQ